MEQDTHRSTDRDGQESKSAAIDEMAQLYCKFLRDWTAWLNNTFNDDDVSDLSPSLDALDALMQPISKVLSQSIDGAPAWPMCTERKPVVLMMQAQLACLASGARYWQQVMETGTRYGPTIASLAWVGAAEDDESGFQDRQVLDELRACLREIGDVSVREATALQLALQGIEAAIREAAAAEPASQPNRYWRAKQ